MIFNKMVDSATTIIDKIHAHPFNQELQLGTLPTDKFIFYLVQDVLYLADFSRALAITAARLPNNHHMQRYIQFAQDAVLAERGLHFGYIGAYQERTGTLIDLTVEQSPSCFMYTNYLLKIASLASVEEAVSSLLPCFFVYLEVGKKMALRQTQQNPYQDWIAMYSSESFELSVQLAIDIVNELADDASALMRQQMIAAFVRATQLEWLFWESAYCQETWLN